MNSFIFFAKRVGTLALVPVLGTSKDAKNFFWSKQTKEPEVKPDDKGTVYFWGNGVYQARPDSKTQFSNFSPKRVVLAEHEDQKEKLSETIPKFADVRFNYRNGFGLDVFGNVWVFENRQVPSFVDDEDRLNFLMHKKSQVNRDNVLNHLRKLGTKNKIAKIALTKRFLWALSDSGKLYSLNLGSLSDPNGASGKAWREVTSIRDLKDIASGTDHLLMLKRTGEVYSMGNDTYGQCGLGDVGRSSSGSFIKTKVPNPELVGDLKDKKVAKIFAAGNHNFVITESQQVYGFGSNRSLQLAHEKEYSDLNNPKLAFYSPVNFTHYLEAAKCDLQDIALAKETTFFICKNKETKMTQVFGCGRNTNGQLGDGRTKHITEFEKIENLSDYTIQTPEGEKSMDFTKFSCGDNHCMALTNFGALLIWGDNEYGQLGNKKRSFSAKPLLVSTFKDKNIRGVKASFNNNYIWTE